MTATLRDSDDRNPELLEQPEAATAEHDLLVEDDLLVEEISIDGMCGVY